MKGHTGIWIDGTKAIIVHLYDQTEVVDVLHSDVDYRQRFEGESKAFTRLGDHFISNEEKEEKRLYHERKNFCNDVIAKLDSECDIVIYGPAQMKHELHRTLQQFHEYHSKEIEIRPADEMTDRQFIRTVKDYYQSVAL